MSNQSSRTYIDVAVIGSVDSGKSTLVGVLTKGILDDGNGSARKSIFVHPHERETGRTSDIARHHYKDDNLMINLIDLAGHEAYLKTTIGGLTSIKPDLTIICISDKITKMTKEHIGLCIALDIPFIILFTKIDIVPQQVTQMAIHEIKQKLRNLRRQMFQLKSITDFDMINKGCVVPFIGE
jgi:small GTP-binding protein